MVVMSREFCFDGYYNPELKHDPLLQPSAHIHIYACIHTHTHTHTLQAKLEHYA